MSAFDAERPTLAEVEAEVREARAQKEREEVTAIAQKVLADREFSVQRRRADEQRRIAAESEGRVVAARIREALIRQFGQVADEINLEKVYRVVQVQVSEDVAPEGALYALLTSAEAEQEFRERTLRRCGLTAPRERQPDTMGSQIARRVPAGCLVGVDPGVGALSEAAAIEKQRRDDRLRAQSESALREADHQRRQEEHRRFGVELG